MTEVPAEYCPRCTTQLDPDDRVWIVGNRFFCSEACARRAAGAGPGWHSPYSDQRQA